MYPMKGRSPRRLRDTVSILSMVLILPVLPQFAHGQTTTPVADTINNAPWYGIGHSNLKAGTQGTAVQLAGYDGLNLQTASGQLVILDGGNVGIGTTSPTAKLAVNGLVKSKEVNVTINSADWPDYVFYKNYALPSLDSLSRQIDYLGHLPGIPSAKEVKEEGIHLGEMNRKLLEKIEQLTLLLIEQGRINQNQSKELGALRVELNELKESSSQHTSSNRQVKSNRQSK